MTSSDIFAILENDPGNSLFVEYANELRSKGDLLQALMVCLRGLSSNPSQHSGRLLLARLFYQLDCVPFAVEQLQIIQREIPDNVSLNRLIDKLGGETTPVRGSEKALSDVSNTIGTLAEADFDVGDLEALGDEIPK